MWVFVDDILVLDIGGIHEPAAGKINFSTGDIYTQDDDQGTLTLSGYDHKWVATKISDIFTDAGKTWDPDAPHTLKMFYLERGGCYSNLAMSFNLPTVKPIIISKNVDKGSKVSSDYDNEEYTFQLYKKSGDVYIAQDEPFTLRNGQNKVFPKLDQTQTYYVKEIDVDSSVYSEVSVNGIPTVLTDNTGLIEVSSDPQSLSVNGNYSFTNKVREELIDLNVRKDWEDNNVDHSNHMVRFRIIRTDENNNTAAKRHSLSNSPITGQCRSPICQ